MTNLLDLLHYNFVWRGLLVGVLVSASCATLGLFLVLRNLSLISDGLAHIAFGAIAVGLFFGLYPLSLSLPLVVVASLIILRLGEGAAGDAAIGMVATVGVAVGIIVASRGGGIDIMSYLFGNILTINRTDMWLAVGLSAVVMVAVYYFYWDFFATTFDNDYAKTVGLRTNFINRLLMVLTAVVVVLSIRVVGAVLVSALIIFPASTALVLARTFRTTMLLAVAVAVVSVAGGMITSFALNLPTGATIVLVNGLGFLLALSGKKFLR